MCFCNLHGQHSNTMTECIAECISFSVDTLIPSRPVKYVPSSTSWITTDLKELLKRRKRALRNGNTKEQRRLQKELKVKLNESSEAYRKKWESKLKQKNVTWTEMVAITEFEAKD